MDAPIPPLVEACRLRLIGMTCIVIAGAIVLEPFSRVYFLTADDVLFSLFGNVGGISRWLSESWETAILKAKIGEFLSMPIMIFGDKYVESISFRVVNLLVATSTLVLFAALLVRAGSLSFAAFFAVLTILTSPLRAFHMPPTSYPLFPTLQLSLLFTAVLLARLRPRTWPVNFLVIVLAMVSSEYVLFFGSAILAFEVLLDLEVHLKTTPTLRARELSAVLGWRAIAAGLALDIHLIFRDFIGVGHYTALAPDLSLMKTLKVQVFHTLNGTIFGPASAGVDLGRLGPVDWLIAAVAAGLGTFGLAQISLPRLDRIAILRLSAAAALVIVFTTLPIALLEKYQMWCQAPQACAYVESRFAGWGAMIIVSVILASVLTRRSRSLRGMALVSIGAFVAATVLHNRSAAIVLEEARTPWKVAAASLCTSPKAWETFLASPEATGIPFHDLPPTRFRRDYWIAWATKQSCGTPDGRP